MSQTQAIFAQAAAPKYGVGETVGNAVSQTVEWLGRTITYIANVVSEYAVKAWDQAVIFFGMAMEFVKENQETFSYVGAAASVGAIGYVLARLLGGSRDSTPAPSPARVPASSRA